jgi:hypothetical protein
MLITVMLHSLSCKGLSYTKASEYASLSGAGNNLLNPTWGSAGTAFVRTDPNMNMTLYPLNLPSARRVSQEIFSRAPPSLSQTQIANLKEVPASMLRVIWAQYLNHDIALLNVSSERNLDSIPVPKCDDFMDPKCLGNKAIPFFGPALYNGMAVNLQTHFVDASPVYGADLVRARALRTLERGKLKVSACGLLPENTVNLRMDSESQCSLGSLGCSWSVRAAGDPRANQNPWLFSLHSIWVREHNRWCDVLHMQHSNWDDETLYQEARRRVIALHQRVRCLCLHVPINVFSVYVPIPVYLCSYSCVVGLYFFTLLCLCFFEFVSLALPVR